MFRKNLTPVLLVFGFLCGAPVLAQPLAQAQAQAPGQVEIPLDVYNALIEAARNPSRPPREVPATHALGTAQVQLQVTSQERGASGEVRVDLSIEVYEDGWILVPVLPAATPVDSATVDGAAVQLIPTPEGLAWVTRKAGAHRMQLVYRVDADRSKAGYSLPVPLPAAAALSLAAVLPGTGLDVAIIPAAGVRVRETGPNTQINATLPTSRAVQVTWRAPSDQGHAISRARYEGQLGGNAVTWSGVFDVELFTDETVTLKLLPSHVTLNELEVDGESAPILVDGNAFATPIKGRGRHTVLLSFESPVVRGDGPPRVDVKVPAVPVSRFDLTLPGKKEVTVTPASNVSSRGRGESTVATVFAPMTQAVTFTWAEAVPDEVRAEVRANASLFHAVHAEEGVLNVRAFAMYEVTRGETSQIQLLVPAGVQVNRITAPSGAVADWRIEGAADKPRVATIFLDRKIRDQLLFEIQYDSSLNSAEQAAQIDLPLLTAPRAHRQRGMIALLSSQEFTLDPLAETEATRVGENQLPAFVREALTMTVAHTFKYVEAPPALRVEASEPERKQGRFDAQVDTLISLGEVTLTGSASVEINVKSGSIMELALTAPAGVNVLNLTGPSIRTHRIGGENGSQQVDVEFTQEMEGQFRLEVSYELILGDVNAELGVPTLTVEGAEVEQGRIAVEALSAVEVQSVSSDQLTALDISELPRQLVLRTTNPILLAYKYVHSDPPYRLALKVTRHELLDVQEAAIDRADYRTLYTRDGLAVTTARFMVRNSRKQFLRISLPAEADVWSAFVDGRPEKPALATNGDGKGRSVLLKIVNSTQGFPVQLIYATPQSRIRGLGKVEGLLPQPDILVTQSHWDVYLPAEMSYGRPSSNMDLTDGGRIVSAAEVADRLAEFGQSEAATQAIEPLRIAVPTAGLHYAFEKLYANQSGEEAWFSMTYASSFGGTLGQILVAIATLLLWGGAALLLKPQPYLDRKWALGAIAASVVIFAVAGGLWGVSAKTPVTISVLLALGLAVVSLRRYWSRLRPAERLG